MKPKLKFLIICAVVIGLGCGFLTFLRSPAFLNWLFRPTEISFKDADREDIHDFFGISLPSDVQYVKGYSYPSRDPHRIYLFEINTSAKSEHETLDSFVRQKLSIQDADFSATSSPIAADNTIFGSYLDEMGYSFTHKIHFRRKDFGEIYYLQATDSACLIAIAFGEP